MRNSVALRRAEGSYAIRGTWNAHSSDLAIDLISLPDAMRRRLSRLLIMRNVNIDVSCLRFQDRDGRLWMATKISDRAINF